MKKVIFSRFILAMALVTGAPAATAGLFDVTLSANLLADDFVINDADGAVFGVAPADTSFSVTLRVDTGLGVTSASAGDPAGTGTYAHDVWGYSASVQNATFGSKTWTDSDIVLLEFGTGVSDSQLFLDAELGAGTPTLASFRVQDDGFAFFGVRSGGVLYEILQGLQIRDFNGGILDNATNDYVLANSYDISVNAVPVPAAFWLFGTALVGLIGFGKRKLKS